ncbi:Imm8 family immunity protein [Paenibacillus macerans]|uniref:Imm8 family immunity protein n=1 Tax=Paenibacillus macerans TaxID=44252 RepID=UPI002DB6019C|nr:Imm8 family immunity protein [Paenibacillus macerans]MEC0333152.1 Imm8 family immunity protein [Paenibacillus macerans]MED4956971.1 Imm8 family immunity protein [Paenibacillus macerans]
MVIPVLKGIDIIEIQDGLKGSKYRGTAYIAEEDDIGSDCFHFMVLTSENVMESLSENKILNGRATFIIQDFELDLLETEIKEILKDCIRPTWEEAAKAINRHLKWEYDNIQFFTEKEILSKVDPNK